MELSLAEMRETQMGDLMGSMMVHQRDPRLAICLANKKASLKACLMGYQMGHLMGLMMVHD